MSEQLDEQQQEQQSSQQQKKEQPKDELNEIDFARLTPPERKRYEAKLRKRRQREDERKGIPSGVEARLKAEWKQNFTAVEADPEKSAALRDRLFEFNYIWEQMRAVIDISGVASTPRRKARAAADSLT